MIYNVDYKPGFSEIDGIVEENLSVSRHANLINLRSNQVLSAVPLSRRDLGKIVIEGDLFLDGFFEELRTDSAPEISANPRDNAPRFNSVENTNEVHTPLESTFFVALILALGGGPIL